jgi:integrase
VSDAHTDAKAILIGKIMTKLLLTVGCTNKRFRLEEAPDGNYWIRFTPIEQARLELGLKGRVHRSTGCKDLGAARAQAKRIIESYYPGKDGKIPAVEAARAKEAGRAWPKLREVLDRFLRFARTLSDKDKMRKTTVLGYIHAFERLVETRFDAHLRRSRAVGYADQITIERAVEPKLWNDYKENFVRSVQLDPGFAAKSAAEQRLLVARAKRVVNFNIGNARSIFGHDFMRLYSDAKFGPALKMPDLTPLRTQVKKCGGVTKNKFKAIPVEQVLAIEAEVEAYRAFVYETGADGLTRRALEARGALICYYLAIRLGLRKGDALQARRSWLHLDRPVPAIRIADEDGAHGDAYDPKGSDGELPLPPDVLRDLLALGGPDYLIPAPNRERCWNIVSDIVRKFVGPLSSKTVHQLRKQAVSNYLIACNGDVIEAAKFSRHADPRTLLDYYGDFQGHIKTLDSSDWRKLAPTPPDNVIPLQQDQVAV